MPRGGWNRKPTALKVLQGTARPDRLPENEPKPRPIAPALPRGLSSAARRLWRELAPKLEKLGLLTETDGPLFEALCEAWARYQEARRRYRRVIRAVDPVNGMTTIRKAEVSVEKAEAALRMLAAEFGLTPASRGRLDVAAEPSEDDAFEAFLSRGGGGVRRA